MQNRFAGESRLDFLLGVGISLSSKSVTQKDNTSGISIPPASVTCAISYPVTGVDLLAIAK